MAVKLFQWYTVIADYILSWPNYSMMNEFSHRFKLVVYYLPEIQEIVETKIKHTIFILTIF